MGKSIGNIALKQRFKDKMVSFLCEKNERLCKGLPVEGINKKLRMAYNYWSLFTSCDLTDDEINCIVNELGNNIVVPEIVSTREPIPEETTILNPEPTYDVLSCNVIQNNISPSGGNCNNTIRGGQYSMQVIVGGGKPPYSYAWSYDGAVSAHICSVTTAEIDADWNVSGQGTDTLLLSDAGAQPVEFDVVVTDDLGNTTQCGKTSYTKSLYE
jgi:hypothetical protein